jgi:hypothetical protein
MHGWMTSRHEGCVSTMLTESGLSIALPLRHFKGLARRNGQCKTTSTAFRGFSVLTIAGFGPIANEAVRSLPRGGCAAPCARSPFRKVFARCAFGCD